MPFFYTCGPNEAMVVSGAYDTKLKRYIYCDMLPAKLCLSIQMSGHAMFHASGAALALAMACAVESNVRCNVNRIVRLHESNTNAVFNFYSCRIYSLLA